MMVRNVLHLAGPVSVDIANQVGKQGLVISIAGAVVLLLGIFAPGLSKTESWIIIVNGGAALMLLGLPQLVQWTVQRGYGTEHCVWLGAWVVTWIGVALVLAYAIYRIVAIFCK